MLPASFGRLAGCIASGVPEDHRAGARSHFSSGGQSAVLGPRAAECRAGHGRAGRGAPTRRQRQTGRRRDATQSTTATPRMGLAWCSNGEATMAGLVAPRYRARRTWDAAPEGSVVRAGCPKRTCPSPPLRGSSSVLFACAAPASSARSRVVLQERHRAAVGWCGPAHPKGPVEDHSAGAR
jgi:hypothetical protein